jgi:hypothetical protein
VIRTLRRVRQVMKVVRPRGGTRAHPQDAA